MLDYRRVFVFLSLVAACGIGARAQVLSYSTFLPQNAGPVSISVNGNGDACAFLTNGPGTFSGAKFRNDGSTVYTFSNIPGLSTPLAAIDATGNCYFAGQGQITPTPGAFQSTPKSSTPVVTSPFVEKFDPSGNLVFATYLGGSGYDTPAGIAVDSSGNVYLTGSTSSNDFPTLNPHQPALATAPDIFIAVLNSTGTGLIYSTYWGGSGDDEGAAIAVDAAHNAYITGVTSSKDFPTVSPFQSSPGGAFVIKLSSTGTPVYSTYLGPLNGIPPPQTFGTAIAADSNGSAYVVGNGGLGFPFKNPLGGIPTGSANFITKFSPDGSTLDYSTNYPGDGFIAAVAVDQGGQAYITGSGSNTTVPLVSAIQGAVVVPGNCMFVSILNTSATGFTFSTCLGQSAGPRSIGIDSIPNIYVSGATGDGLFPILNASNGTDLLGGQGGFLSKISLTPGISLSHPDTVDFSQQYLTVGQSGFGEVLVANTSAAGDISISSSIAISQGDFTQTNNCPAVLVAASTCLVNVTFTPTAGGVRTGTITITDSAPGSPHLMNLTGTGHAPIAVVSPTSLTFAGQAIGTSSSVQQVTLTNSGTASLNISQIGATGDFTESNNCGLMLSNGPNYPNTCQISVTFSPSASGNRTGVLSVTDSASGSPQTVALSGEGLNPTLNLVVPSGASSTAMVNSGSSASYTLSVGGGGVSGAASLTCTGAPKGSACALPSTLNISGTVPMNFNVSVSTTSHTLAALRVAPLASPWAAVAILALVVPLLAPCRKKTLWRCLPLCGTLVLLLASCGGGQNSPQQNPNGTPSGTYNLTVTATVGSMTQSTGLTLTVQ